MATLGPFGLLLIFLALSVAPRSATHVTIHTSSMGLMTFTRESDEWWARQQDVGPKVLHKREGTNLVVRSAIDQRELRTDMAEQFDLSAAEDLTRDATIRAKSPTVGGEARTRVEKDRLVVTVTAEGVTDNVIITWNARR
jgi:hypothetical protein